MMGTDAITEMMGITHIEAGAWAVNQDKKFPGGEDSHPGLNKSGKKNLNRQGAIDKK